MKTILFLLLFSVVALAQYNGGQEGSVTATAGRYYTAVSIESTRYYTEGITLSFVNPSTNSDTLYIGYSTKMAQVDTTNVVPILPGYIYTTPPVMWSAFWIKSSNASGGTHYYYSATGGK